jgi:coniferyl-aldehyde dehydrogenase
MTETTTATTESAPTTMREFSRDEIVELVDLQRQAFLRDGPPSAALRRNRLDRLSAMTFENAGDIVDAMRQDFGNRPVQASMFSDILGSTSDIAYIRRNIGRWMKPRSVMGFTRPMGVRTRVQAQPLGVVGVVGPWNFPVLLLTQPTAAALAAGNRVLMKASDVTPRTALLLQKLSQRYFSPEELTVITGGAETGAAFSSMPLDHLFFTGSPAVGKHIQRAAADNLVPVTLELGGKNPVIVARDADVNVAARRIARSRMVNGGQVCLCPDYAFVPADRCADFVAAVIDEFRRMFPTIVDNPDHCTMINETNYLRVLGLIDDARAKGATVVDATPEGEKLPCQSQRRIAPTVLGDVTEDMAVMTEEVFGPVLSVLPYDGLEQVIEYVNARPSPLVAYWYGKDSDSFRAFCARTRNGGITRNDFALHAAINGAPFGGVGRSGMGGYHGKTGFDTFSHYRTVTESRLPGTMTALLVPPVSPRATKAVNWAVRTQATRLRKRIDRYTKESG